MTDPRDRRPAQFEIPDLELPEPRPSQSGIHAVRLELPQAAPERSLTPAGGLELELDTMTDAPALELSHDGPISAPEVVQYGRAASVALEELAPSRTALEPADGVQVDVLWPSGVTPARERLFLDGSEIQRLAAFGEPSATWLTAPFYAIQVMLRRRALIGALRDVEAALAQAEATRDALLADMGVKLRPMLQQNALFRRPLAALAEAGRSLPPRSPGSGATSANPPRGDSGLREAVERARAEASARAQSLATAEHQRDRAEARHKRCLIELRALESAHGPRDPGREQGLKEQAAALLTEVSSARAAADRARTQSEDAERALSAVEEKWRLAERKASAPAVAPSTATPLTDAERVRRGAEADLGRAILAARGEVPVDASVLNAIRRADADVLALLTRSELHLRALDACDRAQVQRGQFVIAVLVIGSIAFALWSRV